MNREQQVEELTNDIVSCLIYARCKGKECPHYKFDECERLLVVEAFKKIREEMAKEIYKEARERVHEGIEWLNCCKEKPGNEYMKGVTFGLNLFDKALVNAIKKYGVEVKG